MVNFVGAGCGSPDLITLRGHRLISEADVIIYAGSLVNPELLDFARKDCEIYNSAYMNLDEVIEVMKNAERDGKASYWRSQRLRSDTGADGQTESS